MKKKVWAIVADVDGEERYIRQVSLSRMRHTPIIQIKQYVSGHTYKALGKPLRYRSRKKAEAAIKNVQWFDGVENVRLVNLVIKADGQLYPGFEKHTRHSSMLNHYRTFKAGMRDFQRLNLDNPACVHCGEEDHFPYRRDTGYLGPRCTIWCSKCGKENAYFTYSE